MFPWYSLVISEIVIVMWKRNIFYNGYFITGSIEVFRLSFGVRSKFKNCEFIIRNRKIIKNISAIKLLPAITNL